MLQDKRDILKKIVGIAVEENVDLVCDLGDTFDSINPSDKLRYLYSKVLGIISSTDIRLIRILGNHETDGKIGSGVDINNWITETSKYEVIDKPTFSKIKDLEILFIPEVSNEEVIKSLEKYPDALVLGHFGIQGADYGSGKKDETGILLKHIVRRKQPVRLGHYHKRQKHYIGAICKANFGDKDISTGVTIMEFDDSNKLVDERYSEI